MITEGTNPAPFPYRWGKFEGWLLVVWSSLAALGLGAALSIRVRRMGLEVSGLGRTVVPLLVLAVSVCAVIFLMGRGLLRKRCYALQLVYARLVVSLLLACGLVAGFGNVRRMLGSLAWSIPTTLYYHRRRHEFT